MADDRTRTSHDAVAGRYAQEIAGELPAKPIDRALLGCLADLGCGYSIIHLATDDRPAAYAELARATEPNGWLLVSFHINEGEPVKHLDHRWGRAVDLDFCFLAPADVAAGLAAAGVTVMSRTDLGRGRMSRRRHGGVTC
jgi:hypothetical protein